MDRLISEKSIVSLLGISRTTVWRMVRAGEFPRPRAVSENRKAWLESEVSEWVNARPVADAYRSVEGAAT